MADDGRTQAEAPKATAPSSPADTGADSKTVERTPPLSRDDLLSAYRARKLELATFIHTLMTVAAERRDEDKKEASRELLARLAEDRFQLAVVGQFSRGKSTLMNAILGGAYLPTGALPMTSVVTRVRYGSRPRAFVYRGGRSLPIETSLDELIRFVAQSSQEREEQRVVSVEVEVPAEILRLGFVFIDTPGIGSAIAANTATTESFLPEADAVIFVTSVDAPLSEAEVDFLSKVRSQVGKLFLVLNKLDLVSAPEAEGIVRYVQQRLDGGAEEEPRVFAISARLALEARVAGDSAGLASSGLPGLEQTLLRFLTTEKMRVLLLQVAGHAYRLLARQRLELELSRVVQSNDHSHGETHEARFDESVATLTAEVGELASDLREQVAAQLSTALSERSQRWLRGLELLMKTELEQVWPHETVHTERSSVQDTRAKVVDAARARAEGWLAQRTFEAHALLLQSSADHIAGLRGLQQSIELRVAEAFGLSAPESPPDSTAWSPSDLPQIAVGRVPFDVPFRLPRLCSAMPVSRFQDEVRRRLVDGLEEGAAAYSEAARLALVQATDEWAATVGGRAETGALKAAQRLRERLHMPEHDEHLTLLDETGRRLAVFREAVLAWDMGPDSFAASDVAVPAPANQKPTPDVAAPCVICEAIGRVPFEHLAHAQYELATREDSRKEHAEGGGFCAMHTWQYAETASDLGVALAYPELARSATRQLRLAGESAATEHELWDAVAHFAPDRDRCPVCRAVAQAQSDAVADLIADLPARPGDAAAPSLCVPHLAAVLTARPGIERARWLVRSLAEALERAAEDMQMFALIRESLRGHLLSDDESRAYLRTVSRLAGQRRLAYPLRNDDRL